MRLAGSAGVASRDPISNVQVKNIDLAGCACFIHLTVVKTAIKQASNPRFFNITYSPNEIESTVFSKGIN